MAKMYLMCGISGVGKTTYAKRFAQANNLQYLGVDEFYGMMNGDECRHINEFDVWLTFFRAIHMAESANRDCIIDTNALTIVDRGQFLNWFPNFEHHLIFIYAEPELCKSNNRSRRRVVPECDMERMTKVAEHPSREREPGWRTITKIININNSFHEVEVC